MEILQFRPTRTVEDFAIQLKCKILPTGNRVSVNHAWWNIYGKNKNEKSHTYKSQSNDYILTISITQGTICTRSILDDAPLVLVVKKEETI